jgi:hypothetical protein
MKNGLKTLLYLFILRGCLACQHDPSISDILVVEKPIELPDSCGLKTVTYSKTLKPIFEFYCDGCHGDIRASKGINLQGYDNLKWWIMHDSSRVLGSIRYEKGSFMPPGGKLVHCNLQQIETWVKDGMKNN